MSDDIPRGPKGTFLPGQAAVSPGRPKMPEELKVAFRALSADAVNVLRDLVMSDKAKGSDRLRAAEVILDRAWGKVPSAPEDLDAISEARPLAGAAAETLIELLRKR